MKFTFRLMFFNDNGFSALTVESCHATNSSIQCCDGNCQEPPTICLEVGGRQVYLCRYHSVVLQRLLQKAEMIIDEP